MANKLWLGNDSGNEGDLNVAANYTPSGVPAAGDNLLFPAGAPAVTGSLTALNNSTLSGALGVVQFAEGFANAVASSTENMQFGCWRLHFAGSGVAFLDITASAIGPEIRKTAPAQAGSYGLYLIGSAMTTLNLIGGSVAIAGRITETATVATIRIVGDSARVLIGSGVSLTTLYQTEGESLLHAAATTVTVYGGTFRSFEVGAITTLNVYGGNAFPESTGLLTTCNCEGGTTDFTGSGDARTVTNLKQNPGAALIYEPNGLTATNLVAAGHPISLTSEPA